VVVGVEPPPPPPPITTWELEVVPGGAPPPPPPPPPLPESVVVVVVTGMTGVEGQSPLRPLRMAAAIPGHPEFRGSVFVETGGTTS
jgi:hypothetical protein